MASGGRGGFLRSIKNAVESVSKPNVSSPATPSARAPSRMDLRPWWLNGDGDLEVVGESHYQGALERAAGGRKHEPCHAKVVVRLQCEPGNRYDRNAVQVFAGDERVGYLNRDDAIAFGPILTHLESNGFAPICMGKIVGGWSAEKRVAHNFGIWLRVAPPESCFLLCQPAGRLLCPEYIVGVTQEQHYQEAITAAFDRHGAVAFADLSFVDGDPHVKKPTGRVIAVDIDDARVGYLTSNKSASHAEHLEAAEAEGVRATAQASITPGKKGGKEILEVLLLMPRERAWEEAR